MHYVVIEMDIVCHLVPKKSLQALVFIPMSAATLSNPSLLDFSACKYLTLILLS